MDNLESKFGFRTRLESLETRFLAEQDESPATKSCDIWWSGLLHTEVLPWITAQCEQSCQHHRRYQRLHPARRNDLTVLSEESEAAAKLRGAPLDHPRWI